MNQKKQKGVAILLVLSALMLLTTLTLEFASDTQVTFNIAMNERDRLQAYSLALSGIQFSKIILKYDKESKQLVSQASSKLGRNIQVEPLYKMVPVNSAILRGLIQTDSSESDSKESTGEEKNKLEQKLVPIAGFDSKAAQDFLGFRGDFAADIELQDTKIPINAFYNLNPSQPEYDRLKNVLVFLLLQKPFEKLLPDKIRSPQEIAGRIADYVDRNDQINEWGGSERGSEYSLYAGTPFRPKNGKLLTIDELNWIPGISPNLLNELKKYVTIYRSGDKINFCQADPIVQRAMLIAFSQTMVEPLRTDNEDRIKLVLQNAVSRCPDPSAIGQVVNEALGGLASSPTATPAPSTQPGRPPSPPSTGQFGAMLTADEQIFKIEATGTVDEAEVKIIYVVDTANNNPEQWRDLYWRVE